MRTVGYIPKEGAEQKKEPVTEQGGTPTPLEPKADETGTPPEPPEPKDDPVKKGGKKE
jgi:hypothetical protein|nr:MAG TPA: hypothetical protein [Caudoviricetes sp.]